MSYYIVVPKTPFTLNELKVRKNYLNSNKLWKINEGEKLLHFVSGDNGFLREIGIDSLVERVKYNSFSNEEFAQIIVHFFKKGELLSINYEENDYDDEINFLLKKVRVREVQDEQNVSEFIEHYQYITEDIAGEPWHITLYRGNQRISIYHGGSLYVSERKNEDSEQAALAVYEEIFGLFDQPFTVSPIEITEKDTIDHPLKQAHVYLSELLALSGDAARIQAGLSEEEVLRIQESLLKYTKEFENRKVYKD